MEQRKKDETVRTSNELSHPLVIKMGGRQWVVGGEHTTPVELDKSDKLISLSTWMSQEQTSQDPNVTHGTLPLRAWWIRTFERIGGALDALLGMKDGPEQLLANGKNSGVQAVHRSARGIQPKRRLRETFQFGLSFGLALGCACLVLFHQLEPSRLATRTITSNQSSVVLSGLSPGFTLPSLQLYTLQTTTYESQKTAMKDRDALAKLGVPAVLHANPSYTLWCGMAIHAGDLRSLQDKLAKLHVSAKEMKVSWNVQQVAGPTGETPTTAQQVSRWLAACAASLTTLTGAVADGGVDKDAIRAYQTAKSLCPSGDVLAATGYGNDLNGLSKALDGAISAFQAKHMTRAMVDITVACDALSRIQSAAAVLSE